MTALRLPFFALAGLVFGSFLTVLVYRIPRGESIVLPGSACPKCGTPIRPRDNIPVVSYMALRGRCRHCRARISAEYPITELLSGTLFSAASLTFKDLYLAIVMAGFLAVMLLIALIDLHHKRIPNAVTYPSMLSFLGLLAIGAVMHTEVSITRGAIGFAAFGGGILSVVLVYPIGMGVGDVKLAALIGLVMAALAWKYLVVAAVMGVLAGGIGGMGVLAIGRKLRPETLYGVRLLLDEPRGLTRDKLRRAKVPFGPFLAIGAVIATLWAPQIWSWYVSGGS
jgi:leader peptidase (prepilin peptidase) / N-methyltransferase